MHTIVHVFWNAAEGRVRAFWRLIMQGLAWFALVLAGQIAIGVLAAVLWLSTGSLTLDDLANPQTLTAAIYGSPWLLLALQSVSSAATLITVWLAGRLLDRRRFVDFGFRLSRAWWIDFVFGLGLGAFLMLLVFVVELAAGWVTISETLATTTTTLPFAIAIACLAAMFVLVGFSEELFSRGYQLTNLAEGLNWPKVGPRWAIAAATVLSSVFFGLLHMVNPHANLVSTFNIMLAGLLLALGYILTGELAISIGLHITWNFFQGNVFGFPVSGTAANMATFIVTRQGGPDLWTGGAFGPEAGLIGLAAMGVGSLLIVLWTRLSRGKIDLHLPIAAAPERPGRGSEETGTLST